ncbi:hypothetical protein BC2230_40295 [Burkholderia cepacia]
MDFSVAYAELGRIKGVGENFAKYFLKEKEPDFALNDAECAGRILFVIFSVPLPSLRWLRPSPKHLSECQRLHGPLCGRTADDLLAK